MLTSYLLTFFFQLFIDCPYFCDFLSLSSYLLQHNRTSRTASYANLILLILVILVEDAAFNGVICEDERRFVVRLCRQVSFPFDSRLIILVFASKMFT